MDQGDRSYELDLVHLSSFELVAGKIIGGCGAQISVGHNHLLVVLLFARFLVYSFFVLPCSRVLNRLLAFAKARQGFFGKEVDA